MRPFKIWKGSKDEKATLGKVSAESKSIHFSFSLFCFSWCHQKPGSDCCLISRTHVCRALPAKALCVTDETAWMIVPQSFLKMLACWLSFAWIRFCLVFQVQSSLYLIVCLSWRSIGGISWQIFCKASVRDWLMTWCNICDAQARHRVHFNLQCDTFEVFPLAAKLLYSLHTHTGYMCEMFSAVG